LDIGYVGLVDPWIKFGWNKENQIVDQVIMGWWWW